MGHQEQMGHMEGMGHHDEMAIGEPGDAAKVEETIVVSMRETDDGAMTFEPSRIEVRAGETVRLAITNDGETEHEFVMDGTDEIQEHKALMEQSPEMAHADPNAVRLQPGESGEIVWTFGEAGQFEFACLIPGHYESGMHGPLVVSGK
ncbi:cupredoxin domain-containing protein [Jiella sp. CBK1P-4]|uniref:Cupredoxin domain-containing protein n=2 Tax=Jiella avicenniae TaxID=2907202 RepID=A0A9X1T586_9HYPH|nr:plastocyanin/azurin family copper-binding protein [Jiella avicenniae]MCE7028872.1 cupredoxin domain-containing protein [Jiella avicenniae]